MLKRSRKFSEPDHLASLGSLGFRIDSTQLKEKTEEAKNSRLLNTPHTSISNVKVEFIGFGNIVEPDVSKYISKYSTKSEYQHFQKPGENSDGDAKRTEIEEFEAVCKRVLQELQNDASSIIIGDDKVLTSVLDDVLEMEMECLEKDVQFSCDLDEIDIEDLYYTNVDMSIYL